MSAELQKQIAELQCQVAEEKRNLESAEKILRLVQDSYVGGAESGNSDDVLDRVSVYAWGVVDAYFKLYHEEPKDA